MYFIFKLLTNRNFILILAVVLGLGLPGGASFFRPYTLYILAVVMLFSTTGIRLKHLAPLSQTLKTIGVSIILNYFVFGAVLLLGAWWLAPRELFPGFVVIAATPPGVAIIPFSIVLNGNSHYSIIGFIGVFLSSILLAPAIISVFAGASEISPGALFVLMLKLVVLPVLASRLLLHKKILPYVEKSRGQIVNWGFALIIYTAVGLNRSFLFADIALAMRAALVLFISIFLLGIAWQQIRKYFGRNPEITLSQTLMLTIKSSGFAVVTALTLFGERAAIPSAVMAIFVLLFLLYESFMHELAMRRRRRLPA